MVSSSHNQIKKYGIEFSFTAFMSRGNAAMPLRKYEYIDSLNVQKLWVEATK
jgi:hypothetical protein